MNIRCPECQTTFRLDPERIPPQGARARCARCGARFTVQRPTPAAAPGAPATSAGAATGAPMQAPRAPAPASPAPSNSTATATATVAPPVSAAPRAAPAAAPAAIATATQAAVVEKERHAPAPAAPLGAKDPNARAERLARALVSDIVAYHPERRDRSLGDGTLRTEFREEIIKSWEEYVAQVGIALAKSTPYFRDALNKILARGQPLF
jgi:predicted Zn finger-like uncharacterized protein